MRYLLASALSLSALTWAQAGLAFFDAEVFYGSRTSTVKYTALDGTEAKKDLKGTEMGASFLLDPIPLVPVSFGVTAVQGTTNYDDLADISAQGVLLQNSETFPGGSASGTGGSKTMFYGPTLKVWVPIPKVQPYLKATYLLGLETIEQSLDVSTAAGTPIPMTADVETKHVLEHKGSDISLGLGFSPVKLTSIFAEYSIHKGKRKIKTLSGALTVSAAGASSETPITNANLSDEDKKEETADYKSIRLGISIGI